MNWSASWEKVHLSALRGFNGKPTDSSFSCFSSSFPCRSSKIIVNKIAIDRLNLININEESSEDIFGFGVVLVKENYVAEETVRYEISFCDAIVVSAAALEQCAEAIILKGNWKAWDINLQSSQNDSKPTPILHAK